MVFVFHQMLVSALLYLSNKLKALALNVSGEERRRGLYLTDQAQVRFMTDYRQLCKILYLNLFERNFDVVYLPHHYEESSAYLSLLVRCLQVIRQLHSTITSVFFAECPRRALYG